MSDTLNLAWGDGDIRYTPDFHAYLDTIEASNLPQHIKAAALAPYMPKPVPRPRNAEAWLRRLVAKKDVRQWLKSPMHVGGFRYASNGFLAGRIVMPGVADTNDNTIETCEAIDRMIAQADDKGEVVELSDVRHAAWGIWYRTAGGHAYSASQIDMIRQPDQVWRVHNENRFSFGRHGSAIVSRVIV